MEAEKLNEIEKIDSKPGRKHRLPFHSRDLFIRIEVRQPGAITTHSLEFSCKDYLGKSHPTERDLIGTAQKLYAALTSQFGVGIRIGGIPKVAGKDTYA